MSSLKYIIRLDKLNARGEAPVYLQYNHNENKVLIATNQKVEPKDWNKKQGKPRSHEMEEWFIKFKTRFRRQTLSRLGENEEPQAYKIKELWEKYLEEEKNSRPENVFRNGILARWDEYLTHMRQTLTPQGKVRTEGTLQNNQNSKKRLDEYLKTHGKEAIRPEGFTLSDYHHFEVFLVKAMRPNTVSKVKKHFKSFLKWHAKHGGSVGFNLAHIEYAETAGIKIALTETELATIAASDFAGRLNVVRDLIVLQSSTGVRISDLQRLCDNITDDRRYFRIKTRKTGKVILVPILPMADLVLKRYGDRLPVIPEQKYRAGIKRIYKDLFPSKTIEVNGGDTQKMVFVWEEISSHDMVRTFINIAAKKGISIPTIATITGKSIPVIIKNYLNEDQEQAAREVLEKFDVSPLRIAN